jgi:hypothetical protein
MTTEHDAAFEAALPEPFDSRDYTLLLRFHALADPEQTAVPSYENTDWRSLAYRCAKAIEALQAENERLREAGVGYSQQTVDALTKERDSLQVDALRYQWLFNHDDGRTARVDRVYRSWDAQSDWGKAVDASMELDK